MKEDKGGSYQLVAGSDDSDDGAMVRQVSKFSGRAPESRSMGESILTSIPFQACTACIILANGLVIGLETDLPDLEIWEVFEHVFLVLFTSELVFKLLVLGCKEYFKVGPDLAWNIFDVVVVSLGIFDILMNILGLQAGNGSAATVFRMVRLLRILRIFRIVRFLRQLYLLAAGFALAAVAVFWVTCLMGFLLYVCSIMLVRTMGRIEQGDAHYEFLIHRFGNIPKSMFTLFIAMINPDILPYEEVMAENPMFTVFMIAFVIFGSLGLIAVVTGVIMECMFEKNDLRKEMERQELEVSRVALLQTCDDMFEDAIHNEYGDVAIRDMTRLFDGISDTFKARGVLFAKSDVQKMLRVLDVDGSGTVSKLEFHSFIQHMVEGVTPIMVMEILHLVKSVQKKVDAALRSGRLATEERQLASKNLEPLMKQINEPLMREFNAFRTELQAQWSELGQTVTHAVRKESHVLASDRCESAMTVTNAIRNELHLTAAAIRKELQIHREEERVRAGVTHHWDVGLIEAPSISQPGSPDTSAYVSDRLEALKAQMQELMVSKLLSPDLCEYLHAANLCIHSIQQLRSLQAITGQESVVSHKDMDSSLHAISANSHAALSLQSAQSSDMRQRGPKVRTPRSNASAPSSVSASGRGAYAEFESSFVEPPPLTPLR